MGFFIFLLIVVAIVVLMVFLNKKKREKAEIEAKEKAEQEAREKIEQEERKKEWERQEKEREEKWQEDIRTGKVDFDKARGFLNDGLKLLGSGKHYEAIGQFTKAIEFNPRYSEAYHNRGIAYKKNGDLDKAIEDYKKALSLNDNDEETMYNLGLAYMDKKDFDSAYWKFRGVISSPKFYGLSEYIKVGSYMNRGIAKYNGAINDHDRCEGVGDWIEVLEKDHNNSDAIKMIQWALQTSNSPTLKVFVKGMLEQRNIRL